MGATVFNGIDHTAIVVQRLLTASTLHDLASLRYPSTEWLGAQAVSLQWAGSAPPPRREGLPDAQAVMAAVGGSPSAREREPANRAWLGAHMVLSFKGFVDGQARMPSKEDGLGPR